MSETFNPPVTNWETRQWLADDIAADHRPRPFLLWTRCQRCRRMWPCPPRKWADAESMRRLP